MSEYTDAQNHALRFLTATRVDLQPCVWVQAENLAVGGEITHVWLTPGQAARLDNALAQGTACEFIDHTDNRLAVRPGELFTAFEVTRAATVERASASVRVVALTGRVREVRALLADAIAGQRRQVNTSLDTARVAAADLFERETGERRPMWRVIVTDSESPTGIAPVCTAEGEADLHLWANFGNGIERVIDGVWDCCPDPQFDTYSTVLAPYLVALLNADRGAGEQS